MKLHDILQPGDVLLFNRQGFYNRLIMLKTWSRVSHCECYTTGGLTVASRNGKGVNIYDIDVNGLYGVLRPLQPFDLKAAMEWYMRESHGQGYDWIGLLAFFSAKWQGKENGKQFCSEFCTRFLRAGGVDPFLGADAGGCRTNQGSTGGTRTHQRAAAGLQFQAIQRCLSFAE